MPDLCILLPRVSGSKSSPACGICSTLIKKDPRADLTISSGPRLFCLEDAINPLFATADTWIAAAAGLALDLTASTWNTRLVGPLILVIDCCPTMGLSFCASIHPGYEWQSRELSRSTRIIEEERIFDKKRGAGHKPHNPNCSTPDPSKSFRADTNHSSGYNRERR